MSISIGNVVQGSSGSTGVGNYSAPALTVSSGSYIWVYGCQGDNGTITITGVTDGTNSYTQIGSNLVCGSDGLVTHWVTGPVSAGTYTIKETFSSGSTLYPGIACIEIKGSSGLDTSGSPYHHENGQSAAATTSGAVISGNCTPAVQPGLMISVTADMSESVSSVATYTSGGLSDLTASFSGGTFIQFTTGSNKGACCYEIYSSLTALGGQFTVGSTTNYMGSVAVLFAQSGGTGTAPIAWLT
jgi:hypothetical protein